MKVTIVYQSRNGKTASYARQIAMYLWQKGLDISLCATSDFKKEQLEHCDCLMLGCWTSGWFFFHQHPNEIWLKFAREHLQNQLPKNLVLFTTYKIRTGSMFSNMKKELNLSNVISMINVKSRTGILSSSDKTQFDELVRDCLTLKKN